MIRKKSIKIFLPQKISYWIAWGGVIIALGVLNYWYWHRYLSSNSAYITEYQEPEDSLAQYRHPSVAGLFYASSAKQLSSDVDTYLQAGRFAPQTEYAPKILIVPHAGYKYSAGTAGKAYTLLQKESDNIKNVLLLGPAHFYGGTGVYLSDIDYFATPLGDVAINKQIVKQLAAQNNLFSVNNRAHLNEHSLEVQLPFLQKVLPKAKIVPMLYGNAEFEEVAKALKPYLDKKNTILIVSADLSHYHSYEQAQELDDQTAQKIIKGEKIEDHESCGATGINVALNLAKENFYHPQIVELINSGDVSNNQQRVVGYGSWGFYPDSPPSRTLKKIEKETNSLKDFAKAYGKELRQIVQSSLEKAVHHHKHYSPSKRNFSEDLFNKGASFVTLYKKNQLRGCIDSIVPSVSIAHDVADNTYAAALEDNRFSPLSIEELPEITYSISLLTNVEEIKYYNERDLIRKIKAGIDGIVIQDGNRQGAFLPVVWKEFPKKEEFFKQLKIKAGMSPSYWNNQIKVYRFRTVEIKNEN